MNDIYLKLNHLFSYGTKIVGIIGARGIGKTYGCKKYLLKQYFRCNKKFAILRDNERALDELVANNCSKFLKDVKDDPALSKFFRRIEKIYYANGILYFEKKEVGYFMACSTFYKLKGNSYNDVQNILYDEFIAEKVQVNRGNRALEFVNMIETIGRIRNDYRVLMTANALDIGDEILDLLGIKIKDFGYYVNRKKNVAVLYSESSPLFLQAKAKSIVGGLVTGSTFEDNIIHNKFDSNKVNILDKRPTGTFCLCILKTESGMRLSFRFKDGLLYCWFDNNENANSYKRFVVDFKLASVDYPLCPKSFTDAIKAYASQGKLYFDSERVYKEYQTLWKNTKK